MWIEYQQGLLEFLGLLGREQKRVGRIEPSWLSKWIAGWVFLITTTGRERGLEMTAVGSAVVGEILGASGMQLLRSTNPEMVEKVEDDIKRFMNSTSLSKSKNKKEKDKWKRNNYVLKKKGNVMLKTLGILISGVFVGAVGAEILQKKYPDTLEKLYAKPREMAREMREAFKNGYKKANQSGAATA